MAKVEQASPSPLTTDVPEGTTNQTDESSAPKDGAEKTTDGSDHPVPGSYFNGTSHVKRPQPAKVFFAPQKYGFFTMNKVEQRWRDDPEKEKKTHADDIIANVTEKFFPGQKRNSAEAGMPMAPSFMPPPPGVIPPALPPPPFMIPPTVPGRDGKRIKFNDEESDENELFAKLLYKKLNSISSRKRLEILHVSIMEMVRQAQEEDERERGVGIMNPSTQPPLMN